MTIMRLISDEPVSLYLLLVRSQSREVYMQPVCVYNKCLCVYVRARGARERGNEGPSRRAGSGDGTRAAPCVGLSWELKMRSQLT